MNRALRPMKQTLWNVLLRKHGSLPRSSRPLLGQAACRGVHSSPPARHGGQIHGLRSCNVSSARFLSSGPVVSPADMRSPLPDLDMPILSLGEFIFSCCDEFKDNIALSDGVTGRQYTYPELKKYAIRVASALHRQGFRKGDVICTFTINLPEFSILVLAAACLGVIVSPLNPAYIAGELSHTLKHNGARAIFTIPS